MRSTNETRPCCNQIDLTKLGRCRQCIVLSTLLALSSWTAYFAARQTPSLPGLPALCLALSFLFTLLVLAHALAYVRRRRMSSREPMA